MDVVLNSFSKLSVFSKKLKAEKTTAHIESSQKEELAVSHDFVSSQLIFCLNITSALTFLNDKNIFK